MYFFWQRITPRARLRNALHKTTVSNGTEVNARRATEADGRRLGGSELALATRESQKEEGEWDDV